MNDPKAGNLQHSGQTGKFTEITNQTLPPKYRASENYNQPSPIKKPFSTVPSEQKTADKTEDKIQPNA